VAEKREEDVTLWWALIGQGWESGTLEIEGEGMKSSAGCEARAAKFMLVATAYVIGEGVGGGPRRDEERLEMSCMRCAGTDSTKET
jgi:hypothetical protein